MTDDAFEEEEAPASNIVNPAMVFALVRTETRLERDKKAASAALSAHHRRIKGYGLKIANFLAAYRQFTADDEGDEYIEDMREQQRLMQCLRLPVGHQFDLLDAPRQDDPDAPGRAYKAGMRAFLDVGPDEFACPHPQNSAEGQEWLKGLRDAETLCGEGDKDLAAIDGDNDRSDAAEGTLDPPKDESGAPRKRGRPKGSKNKPKPNGASEVAPVDFTP